MIDESIITTENYNKEITLEEKQKVNTVRPENSKLHERLISSNLDQFEDKGNFPQNLSDLDLANESTGRGAIIKVFRYTLSKMYLGNDIVLEYNQMKKISNLDDNKINSASAGNMKAISQTFTHDQKNKANKIFSVSDNKLTLNEIYIDEYFKGEAFVPENKKILGVFLFYFINKSMITDAIKCSEIYYDNIKADEEKQKKAEIEDNKQYNKALKFFGLK